MRSVRLIFGSGASLVLASILTGGCGGDSEGAAPQNSMGGSGGALDVGDAPQPSVGGTGGVRSSTVATGGTITLDSTACSEPASEIAWVDCHNGTASRPADYPFPNAAPSPGRCQAEFYVPVAAEGTVPSVAEICASTASEVSSGWAARVTLTDSSTVVDVAKGRIALGPSLVDATVTTVALEVVDKDDSLGDVTLGAPTKDGDVYVFEVTFGSRTWPAVTFPRLVIAVTLTLDCAGSTREVTSTTALYLCADLAMGGGATWISSGDACGECAIICEMIASPTMPAETCKGQALSQAVRAQVTRVGQYGDALLMQVRHNGGPDRFEYQWDVSAGEILWRDNDLMLWAPPNENAEHLVQVALLAEDAAAVSSYRMRSRVLVKG